MKTHPIWRSIRHLYSRPWFRRLWTFQEVVLARRIQIISGKMSMDWDTLIAFHVKLTTTGLYPLIFRLGSNVPSDALDNISDIVAARTLIKREKFLTGVYQIPFGDRRLVSNPLDRVYGMLSLTKPDFQKAIEISYRKTAEQDILNLYLQFGKYCILQDINFLMLQYVADRERNPLLPSWCLDLRTRPRYEIERFPFYPTCAGGKISDTPSFQKDALKICGFRADVVSHVGTHCFSWYRETDEAQIKLADKIRPWAAESLALSVEAYHNCSSDSARRAHISTLTADTKGSTEELAQSSKDYELMVDSFHNITTPKITISERTRYYTTQNRIVKTCGGRRFFNTTKGRIGLGPPRVKPGDIVCVFYGSQVVLVCRASTAQGPNAMELIGDAFVHGLMDLTKTPLDVRGQDEEFAIY
jgi:hypothetical protein